MEYQVAVDPDLGIDMAELIEAWNSNQKTREIGLAQPSKGEKAQLLIDPDLVSMALLVAGNVTINLVSNGLYDIIKAMLFQKRAQKETEIIQLKKPDGTELLIVRIKE